MTNRIYKKKYVIALGFFDGLHKAHMAVINKAAALSSENIAPAIILFDKNPQQILSGEAIPFILQPEKRDKILASLKIASFKISFEKIKDMSPEKFVENILCKRFNAAAVSCGFNYRFGKNGEGDSKKLTKLCFEKGVEVYVCPEMKECGNVISSTEIRSAIEQGNIKKANIMLGRPFCFSAKVVHGDNRGRLLNAPTINQPLPMGIVIPRSGVYAVKVKFEGREYTGVTNIGIRPTFDGRDFRSETFILGFEGDLYGKMVELKFFDFLRDEKKFSSADELKKQIISDAKFADALFLHSGKTLMI